MSGIHTLLSDVRELQALLEQRAFGHYIRKGRVPEDISGLRLLLAEMEEYCTKYNPNWETQPRVPSGNPDGGQWTEGPGGGGGGGNDGGRRQENDPQGEREIYDPPIEPSYLIESLVLPFLRVPKIIAAFQEFIAANRRGAHWVLGQHKSPAKWARQMEERNWTPQQIDKMLKSKHHYEVENKISPRNRAVQYYEPKTKRFVVYDEVQKEVLQVSGPGFNFNLPKFKK